jgi:hypothetical protein
MRDDLPKATAIWQEFSQKHPVIAADPAAYFERLAISPFVSNRLVESLNAARARLPK